MTVEKKALKTLLEKENIIIIQCTEPHSILVKLTHSLTHHFETIPNSKKLQTTTEMWLLKDFKIQIA